jgi:hypothetical protein
MDTDASTMSVSHKTYPRRCVCARIYEFAMDRRERAQYIESLAERHARRYGLLLKSARRHIEQIAVSARSTVAARDEN